MNEIIKRVAGHFLIKGEVIYVDNHLNGLVNKTFLVRTKDELDYHDYIIQRINTYVFTKPVELMENIVHVTQHIASKENDNKTLNVVFTQELAFVIEYDGSWYRCYEYLANSENHQALKNVRQFKEVGRAVGIFQNHLSDFPVSLLHVIIPDFHNTPKRLNQLMCAKEIGDKRRVEEARSEINTFFKAQKDLGVIQTALDNNIIPYRVTHNDTKLNNVMFDKTTSKALCLIDLDTVMPGAALFDYGDALRVGASTTEEDDGHFENIQFDIKKFIAFTAGYLLHVSSRLTDEEYNLLADSVYIITMECGMRFLTDYLLGDKYFLIKYPTHNLVRSEIRICLAKDIKKHMSSLKLIINQLKNRFNTILCDNQ